MTKKELLKIILLEDDPHLRKDYQEVSHRFADKCEPLSERNTFSDGVTALRFVRKKRRSVDGILMDLRIHFGPNEEGYVRVDTDVPAGERFVLDLEAEGITDIPVVVYSRFLSAGSPSAASAARVRQFSFVKAVLSAAPDPEALLRKALRAIARAAAYGV